MMFFFFATFDSSSGGMALAKRLSCFHKKPLSFKIFLAQRAVEALGVVVVVESLHPPISGLYGEPTVYALCGEQLVPVIFTVGQTIL